MSEQRADGFWWVHVSFESPDVTERSTGWYTASVERAVEGGMAIALPGFDDDYPDADDEERGYWFIEWGPYLGKAPGERCAKESLSDWLDDHCICELCMMPGLPCECWNDE